MSDSMHPQRAQALNEGSGEAPPPSDNPAPASAPAIRPPPGFGGVQVAPPPGFGGAQIAPPRPIPQQPLLPTPNQPLLPHPQQPGAPDQDGSAEGAAQAPHPLMQGPPGFVPPPYQVYPPGYAPYSGAPPGHGGGLPFHPSFAVGYPPGFPHGALPGQFGPPGFGRGMPQFPHQPHQPIPNPAYKAPAHPGLLPPQIQMMTAVPQLSRSGVPLMAQVLAVPTPTPSTGEADDKPLNFKSSATPQAQTEEGEWTEAKSEDGAVYYYNTKTMESSWDMPKGYKVKSKPKPVSWEPIGDGKWKKVTLDNKQQYYFNTATKESHWTMPPEVAAILVEKKAEAGEGAEKTEGAEEGDEKDPKKQKTESAPAKTKEEIEAEEAAAKKAAEEHQKNIETFKEMLRDCKVARFSKWEKELPKFVSDARFQLLPNHTERRTVFDQYVRSRVQEDIKEKKAKTKLLHDAFRQLIEEHDDAFNVDFTFKAFQTLVEGDARWGGIEEKDREMLFNERMSPYKKELEDKKKGEFDKAKNDFVDLLKEHNANSSTSWARLKVKIDRDTRYKHELLQSLDKETLFKEYIDSMAEDSAKRKKREREEASKREREREVKEIRERENRELEKKRRELRQDEEVAHFRALLQEKVKDPQTTWKEALKLIDADPRFRTQNLSRDDKDNIFAEHIRILQEKAIKDFKSLLIEKSLDISIDWKHAKDLLRDDKRYTKVAERDRQTTFDRHIRDARRAAREDFRELLQSNSLLTHATEFDSPQMEKIKSLMRDDKRYMAWNSEKSERDKMIKEHIEFLKEEYSKKPQKKLTLVDDDEEGEGQRE